MPSAGDTVVSASDVTIEYPGGRGHSAHRAVDGVTFTVGRGELMGLVGETGSGKSTFARAVAGGVGRGLSGEDVPRIVGGSLHVLGHELRRLGRRGRNRLSLDVGYLPQNAGRLLLPGHTIAENVGAPILEQDRHYDRRELGARVAELLDSVQLPLKVMGLFPHEISSGQRQRVAIARSLVHRPLLWVADEPTAGVDVTARGPVLDSILELQSEHDFSALIVSHEAAVTARVTDRVAVLQGGHLVGLGRLDDVLENGVHPYIRGLAEEYRIATGPIDLPEFEGEQS
ncbi:ATP-binding cassette domain-containing protein [Naasia sp. SYSU D00948]|uniref:ATP-binding cassette domain-containing protein n=1 Tax=Naasia sp. SYSU D00948 TaxID=2817379 RepID=UPI001B308EC0|nr:ATP-binding cassette domain-containing protein [Naasia sp. SYSU D00948]